LFLIPVVVAFVFSYFHGAFTGHFWETLGLRAAKSSPKAPTKTSGTAARGQHGHQSSNKPLAQS
ncbi:MAG TPA: hypothetical protein PLY96_16565, partial [Chromatiaceae bacterium]|nr:hypothetical protein [Chromatiaceae bacterium]